MIQIPKFKLIGHRGVAGLRPENTICSFEYAADLGLDWIEFDIQLSLDDQWVVMHDDTLDRTTTGRGLVSKWTLSDLEELDAGLWFKPPYPRQKIPTLIDTLRFAQSKNLFCDVEIKNPGSDALKYAELFAEFFRVNPGLNQNLLVTSFNLECLIYIRKLMPSLSIGINIEKFSPETIVVCQKHNFANINCNVHNIHLNDLQTAQSANLPVFLYTVNDLATAKLWLTRGAAALFTDRPDLLLD